MTHTATAPLTIPAEGLVHTNGDVVLAVRPHPVAGFRIEARRNDFIAPELCSTHTFEVDARRVWAALLEQYPASPAPEPTPAAPAIPAQRLAPVAKGRQTKVSDPGHTALAVAEMYGRVERGGKAGQASVKVLTALAKRGYLALTYQTGRRDARRVVTGGTITGPGRTRLNQLTAAEREVAEHAARLATALTINVAA
ncbi:hypothetical protein Drose_05615 [Dactylosporangium roseum]|uniref:Uncharacterized protein n=1 Tax=Dactylosporangium roseum TaxID=47989 RepID=A0ABY5Z8F9_9ACTN|nr:hypothetical protein [Dactylosporangium roseum]UWZ37747.1 hypothetical protein Drose_05615 [Dactylosporangium roseum]